MTSVGPAVTRIRWEVDKAGRTGAKANLKKEDVSVSGMKGRVERKGVKILLKQILYGFGRSSDSAYRVPQGRKYEPPTLNREA